MFFLAQAMPILTNQVRSVAYASVSWGPRLDDLGTANLVVQPPEPVRAPAGQPGSVPKLRNGDKEITAGRPSKHRLAQRGE